MQIASGKRHDWRNLFLLYPYEPADEREALIHVQRARAGLTSGSITTQVVSWGAYTADFLKSRGFVRLPLKDADEYRRLERNLAERLPEHLADRTEQALQGRPRTHVVFVVRTGAIYPFTTISQTLAVCETGSDNGLAQRLWTRSGPKHRRSSKNLPRNGSPKIFSTSMSTCTAAGRSSGS